MALEKKEKVLIDETEYTQEVYSNGLTVLKPEKQSEKSLPEPTEEEILQAELLLNQMEILANQNAQDKTLAAILLNQMEV